MSCTAASCACGRVASVRRHVASGSASSSGTPATEALQKKQSHIARLMAGSVISGFIALGLRLGFFAELSRRNGTTSMELAAATNKSERWIREWCASQAAAGILDWTEGADGEMKYSVSPEVRELLLDTLSPNYLGGFIGLAETVTAVMPETEASFTTGIGHSYDNIGRRGNTGMTEHHIPVFVHTLVPRVIPQLASGSVLTALERGCRVADVGCGAGGPTLALAKIFPKCEFHGFEVSSSAIELARENIIKSGVANFQIHDARVESLSSVSAGKTFDFVLTYDVLHDAANPEEICKEVKLALTRNVDARWLVVDIQNFGSIAENIRKLKLDAAVKYSISMAVCMSSALSEPDGRGLGTLGLTTEIASQMFADAGFSRVRPFLVEGSGNQFFEIAH